MKIQLYLIALAVFCCTMSIEAQDAREARESHEPSEPIRIGAFTAWKAAVNSSSVPTGWKTGPTVDAFPDLGICALVPIKSSMGLSALVDVGLCSQSFLSKPYNNPSDSNTLVQRYQYLSFAPALSLPYAYLALNIGVPLHATAVSLDGSINQSSSLVQGQSTSIVHQLSTLMELRLGGTLPLVEDAHGMLMGFAQLSYPLGSVYKSFSNSSPLLYSSTVTKSGDDPRPVAMSFGLRYYFEWASSNH